MGTAVVILILALIVGLIIRGMVKDHKKGKFICGGDCSNCGHACQNDFAGNAEG